MSNERKPDSINAASLLPQRDMSKLDKLIAYLTDTTGTVKIGSKEADMIKRLNVCHDLLCSFPNRQDVVAIMVKKFNTKENSYSQATAYRDIQRTQAVFGVTNKFGKEYLRNLLIEKGINMLLRLESMEKADAKGWASIARELRELGQLDKDDVDRIDPEDIVLPLVQIGFIPEELKTNLPSEEELQRELQKLREPKTPITKFYDQNAEDAEEAE